MKFRRQVKDTWPVHHTPAVRVEWWEFIDFISPEKGFTVTIKLRTFRATIRV